MHQIRGCTLGNGGHAAFASILWSPPLRVFSERGDIQTKENFQGCLSQVPCDVLLVFGKDDPWVSFLCISLFDNWFVID